MLGCRDWTVHAKIQHPRNGSFFALRLSSRDGLRSDVDPQQDYDSSVEQSFAEKWGDIPRDGWRLIREDELLCRDQKVFVPDFVLQHDSGRRVLLEIVGFWTPEYLSAKAATLRAFSDEMILLAVADSVQHAIPGDIDLPTVVFKRAPTIKSVLGLANQTSFPAGEFG